MTKWGVWYSAQFCPKNSYATGYALKYEKSNKGFDKTALNAINLLCTSNKDTNSTILTQIASNWNTRKKREEYETCGEWDSEFKKCASGKRLKQFALRVERPQGTGGDDTAANSLRMSCDNMKSDEYLEETNMDAHGQWSEFKRCPSDMFICGMKVQVELPQGAGDDTALNNVNFFCCP